jgi:uncharacterized protein
MYLYCIPFEEKFIIYRPLLHAAFIGNRAMAEVVERYLNNPVKTVSREDHEAYSFLKEIGFLEPDPPAPAPPEPRYQPVTAVLLATNRCNLRCTYCYAEAGEKTPEDMPIKLAKQAIDTTVANAEKAGMPFFELVFHGGGEPTQNWQLLTKTVEYTRRKKVRSVIAMSSNGIWSEKQRSYVLDNFDGLSLSFDGTKEVQDAQRPTPGGGSSFAVVMKSIKVMDKRNFPYNIRLTISSPWLEKLPECVRFICEETGSRHIQVEPAFSVYREGWQNPSPEDAGRFIAAFTESLDVAEKYQKELMYAGARPWMTICSFCSAAETALVVRPDGKLVACYEVTDSKHKLADFFTVGNLESNGPLIDEEARERLTGMRQQRLALCEDCFCLWHCGGDCSSRCFSPDGTAHLRFDQRCRINREISKEILARYVESTGGVWRAKVEVLDEDPHRFKDKPSWKRGVDNSRE